MPNTVNRGGEGWAQDNQAYRAALETAAQRYGGAQAPQLLQVMLNMGRLETNWTGSGELAGGGWFQISDGLARDMQREWGYPIQRTEIVSAADALARFISEVGTGTGLGATYNTPRSDTINLEVGPGMWHGGIGGYTRFLTGNTTQSQDGIGPRTTRYTVQALQGALNPDQYSQPLQTRYTQIYGADAWPTAAGNSGILIGTVGIGGDARVPLAEPTPLVGPNTGIQTDFNWSNQLTWNPLTQEQAGHYSGSPDLTYRGGLGGQEAGWGFYGDTPIAPFYRLSEEQAGWLQASPTLSGGTVWNPEQNSWGVWGEPPLEAFPTGRMDYMQQLSDWGISHPGQIQLWDASPEFGSGQSGQRSWFDLFNPVGTARAGLEPLPPFLQDWDPNIGQGPAGALTILPNEIWEQWDPNIAAGYPGGLTAWDASPSRTGLSRLTLPPMPGVDPGNLGMWDFNAANPLNPFSSQYTGANTGGGNQPIHVWSGDVTNWVPAEGTWGTPWLLGPMTGYNQQQLDMLYNPMTGNWGTVGNGVNRNAGLGSWSPFSGYTGPFQISDFPEEQFTAPPITDAGGGGWNMPVDEYGRVQQNTVPTPAGGYGSTQPSPAQVFSEQYQAQVAAQQAAWNAAQVAAFNQQQALQNQQNIGPIYTGPSGITSTQTIGGPNIINYG